MDGATSLSDFLRQPLHPSPIVRSIGLILYDDQGQILMGQEGRNNPAYGKKRSDYTFPWETWEVGKTPAQMLRQACDEEGGTDIVFTDLELVLRDQPVFETRATIFQARVVSCADFRGSAVNAGEILEPGMVFIPIARFLKDARGRGCGLLPMRSGVKEALKAFRPWFILNSP